MKITVMTLFPEFFDSFVTTSIIKRAIERELVTFETIDFRAYTKDKHNHVDLKRNRDATRPSKRSPRPPALKRKILCSRWMP